MDKKARLVSFDPLPTQGAGRSEPDRSASPEQAQEDRQVLLRDGFTVENNSSRENKPEGLLTSIKRWFKMESTPKTEEKAAHSAEEQESEASALPLDSASFATASGGSVRSVPGVATSSPSSISATRGSPVHPASNPPISPTYLTAGAMNPSPYFSAGAPARSVPGAGASSPSSISAARDSPVYTASNPPTSPTHPAAGATNPSPYFSAGASIHSASGVASPSPSPIPAAREAPVHTASNPPTYPGPGTTNSPFRSPSGVTGFSAHAAAARPAAETASSAHSIPPAQSAVQGAAQNACDPAFQCAQWFSSGSIGGILLDAGKIRAEHAEQILRLQKTEGLRFGEAAIKLGLATESDIQFALSRQFDYPYLSPDEQHISQELVAAYQPFSHQVESLRAMRTQLMLRWFDSGSANSIAVVSAAPGDGRSYLAANLAVVFSQLGEKTLLIDADLRSPRQHELFGLENQSGFSTYLSGRSEAPTIHRVAAFVDLSILPAGPIPPNPQELLYRSQFSQLLMQMTRDYNVVILDTPSANYHADAQLIAAKTGTTLIVTRKDRSKVRDIAVLVDSIRSVGGNIVGGIVNDY